jgi:hypothetical protein
MFIAEEILTPRFAFFTRAYHRPAVTTTTATPDGGQKISF